MPERDLHEQPFDEGTKTKLLIYRSYIRAWLQVFLHSEAFRGKPLQFFDFFSGPGRDSSGEPGSPLILIEELLLQRVSLEQRGHEVRIFFNDKNAEKIESLKRLCSERSLPWKINFESLEFARAFEKVQKKIGISPSLVFIDQNGLKHVTRPVFDVLIQAETTDFLFFTASSFAWRFGDLIAPDIQFPEEVSYLEVHRVLADKYREWAPTEVFIGHFSIKKESNIYGLIFGSHHWRGMQKFLEIAWKLDGKCGEADFPMESEFVQGEIDFDKGTTKFKKRKVEVFQEKVTDLIRMGKLKTDDAVFIYCLVGGFLPRVAKDVYIRLREDGVLKNAKATFPRYSGDVMKSPRKLET